MNNIITNIQDQPSTVIKDVVNGKLIKVYPYEFVNANKSKAFIKQNSVSIAAISQSKLDINDELLKTDANGFKYFEMFSAITSEGKLDLSSHTSVYGKELKEEDSFIAISNWYYEGEFKDIQIGAANFMPALFVIGEPFDRAKYEKGEQATFIPTSMIEAKEGVTDAYDINPEGLYEFRLINITAIEATFTNCRILFEVDFNKVNTNISFGKNINDLNIKFDFSTLISFIKLKGEINGRQSDIDLETDSKLFPIKMTPIDTTEKLTMYADWFDYDVVMPLAVAKLFTVKNGIKISDFINLNVDNVKIFSQRETNLLIDLLSISSAYIDNLKQYPRYTKDEAKKSGGGAREGQIHGDITIGSSKIAVMQLEGKSPINVLNDIFENYINENPGYEETGELKYLIIKELIAALSKFIKTKMSIGLGGNSFNKAFLPWYLSPLSSLENKKDSNDSKNYIINQDLNIKLNSKYFDIINSKIVIKQTTDLSDIKIVQTDRKLTLPKLDNVVNSINKLTLPGDLDTKSSKDLKYILYAPFNQESDIEQIFLKSLKLNSSSSTVKTRKTFNSSWSDYGKPILYHNTNVTDFIIKQAVNRFSTNKSNITILDTGDYEYSYSKYTLVPRPNPNTSYWIHTKLNKKGFSYLIEWAKELGTWSDAKWNSINPWIPTETVGKTPPGLSNSKYAELRGKHIYLFGTNGTGWMGIAQALNLPIDSSLMNINQALPLTKAQCDKVDKAWNKYVGYDFKLTGTMDNQTPPTKIEERYKRERLENISIEINGSITETTLKRKVLFDKNDWEDYLKLNINFKNNHEIELKEKRGITIDKINEIVIGSVWGNSCVINLNGHSIKIPMFNKDDETIGIQRILFT